MSLALLHARSPAAVLALTFDYGRGAPPGGGGACAPRLGCAGLPRPGRGALSIAQEFWPEAARLGRRRGARGVGRPGLGPIATASSSGGGGVRERSAPTQSSPDSIARGRHSPTTRASTALDGASPTRHAQDRLASPTAGLDRSGPSGPGRIAALHSTHLAVLRGRPRPAELRVVPWPAPTAALPNRVSRPTSGRAPVATRGRGKSGSSLLARARLVPPALRNRRTRIPGPDADRQGRARGRLACEGRCGRPASTDVNEHPRRSQDEAIRTIAERWGHRFAGGPDRPFERIKQLTEHFKDHKNDYAARRGLLMMVGKRSTLLKYLKAKSPQRFDVVVKRLGLRAG